MATLKETAAHFGISIQAMSDYVNKHITEINTDGEHAVLLAVDGTSTILLFLVGTNERL